MLDTLNGHVFEYRVILTRDTGRESGHGALYLVDDDGQWTLALDSAWAGAEELATVVDGIDNIVLVGTRRLGREIAPT